MIAELKHAGGRPRKDGGRNLEPLTPEQAELVGDPKLLAFAQKRSDWIAKQWPSADRDEVCSALHLAIIQAARTFDAEKGASFRTHAYLRMNCAVRDYCRQHFAAGMLSAGVRQNKVGPKVDSLSVVIAEGYRTLTLGDHIEAPDDRDAEEAQSREYAISLLSGLSERSRRVIVGYVLDGKPMKQVAQEAGISESRVSQLYARLIEELKEPVRRRLDATA